MKKAERKKHPKTSRMWSNWWHSVWIGQPWSLRRCIFLRHEGGGWLAPCLGAFQPMYINPLNPQISGVLGVISASWVDSSDYIWVYSFYANKFSPAFAAVTCLNSFLQEELKMQSTVCHWHNLSFSWSRERSPSSRAREEVVSFRVAQFRQARSSNQYCSKCCTYLEVHIEPSNNLIAPDSGGF